MLTLLLKTRINHAYRMSNPIIFCGKSFQILLSMFRNLFVFLIWSLMCPFTTAEQVNKNFVNQLDLQYTHDWASTKFLGIERTPKRIFDGNTVPFSFHYDGKDSQNFLGNWIRSTSMSKSTCGRTTYSLVFMDPETKLQIECVGIEYDNYPTLEYIVSLKNLGTSVTPVIEDLLAADIQLQRESSGEFILHHHWGDGLREAWMPIEETLGNNTVKNFVSVGGRPTNIRWPYYNIELPGNKGVIFVLGWHGQWSTRFSRNDKNVLRIQGGQEKTHFVLLPGEEARTPRVVLQFWSGDRTNSQNIWRRWMIEYNLPKIKRKQIAPMWFGCSWPYTWTAARATETNQKEFIQGYINSRLPIDGWWIDAGWYYCPQNAWEDYRETGTWEVDKRRFPNGLLPISNLAHRHGIKMMLWFDPQRVWKDSWLWKTHPEWLLEAPYQETDAQGPGFLGVKLLNLGNPDARKWLTEHVDLLMKENAIDIYRHDHNTDLLNYWRLNDSVDRQGITEMRDIEGNLTFWKELLQLDPNRLIDTCSSGGRRLDLESLRLAVPFWRSDIAYEPVLMQGQSYGLSFWVPYHGLGVDSPDKYRFRSQMFVSSQSNWDVRSKHLDVNSIKELVDEWKQIAHLYLKDYYPLTPYSIETTKWMAWQYNDPQTGEGVVQAFRREDCPDSSVQFKLRGIDENLQYRLYDFDQHKTLIVSGSELLKKGLVITIPIKPGAAMIKYVRL